MIFALDGNFAYSFMLGVLAAVNPCGFVLLPAYLLYYLGIENVDRNERASMRRALAVSAAVSGGFLLVFLVIGTISRLFTQWIELNAKYAGFVVGVLLIALGIAMLLGWKPSFTTPTIKQSGGKSLRSMFLFGVAYAVASIGCTIGFLTTAIFGSIGRDGFVSGVISIVLYGLGMSLLVTTLTISLAAAQRGLVTFLKRGLPYMDRIAAVFITLTGMYLSWYWFVAITERDSLGTVGSNVERWQSAVANFLQQQGAFRLTVFFVVVVTAATVAVIRTQRRSVTAQVE